MKTGMNLLPLDRPRSRTGARPDPRPDQGDGLRLGRDPDLRASPTASRYERLGKRLRRSSGLGVDGRHGDGRPRRNPISPTRRSARRPSTISTTRPRPCARRSAARSSAGRRHSAIGVFSRQRARPRTSSSDGVDTLRQAAEKAQAARHQDRRRVPRVAMSCADAILTPTRTWIVGA